MRIRRAAQLCYFSAYSEWPDIQCMSRWIAFAVMFLFIAQSSFGADSAALYQIDLPVAVRDDAARGGNFRRALSLILGRIISREALESKSGGAILGRAADFVEQFEYLSAGGNSRSEVLRVRFDDEELRDALQRARIGVWGAERPDIVVWLLMQDGAERRFVDLSESPEFDRALKAAADQRALPITSPLWDLTDQASLTWADAETGNRERIREATRRYGSDNALVGRLQRAADHSRWDSSWRFSGLGGAAEWQANSLDLDAALQSGIDGAYGRLIDLYAPLTREETVVEIEIEGVDSMTEAERCGEYLRGLPIVKRADWVRAEASGATWRLTLAGRTETLRQILAVSRALRPAAARESGGPALNYSWMP